MMFTRLLFCIVIYSCFCAGCSKKVQSQVGTMDTLNGVYIPKDLKEAMLELDKLLPEEDKQEIKSLSSRDQTLKYHHNLGMWIRNNWALWGGSRLALYLREKGVMEPDGMSAVILSFYHDWLTQKDINWNQPFDE